ncbi:MAG TPA: hypothetical protein VGY49_07110 [Burkholderiaceae bacterium]|jgi:hypothetical protein|nr:hypothetical protein [Burkholderiaceae bacterium]
MPDTVTPVLQKRLCDLLAQLQDEANAVRTRHRETYRDDPAIVKVTTSLAQGADTIGAEAALSMNVELQAILPFARAEYAKDFDGDRAKRTYDRLLHKAARVLELPGDRRDEVSAYRLAGEILIRSSDLLIAIWDGGPGRGPGGTADIVEQAVHSGLPVLHIDSRSLGPGFIRWVAWADAPDCNSCLPLVPSRPIAESLRDMTSVLLRPPSSATRTGSKHSRRDPGDRQMLDAFLHEQCSPKRNLRLAYALFLRLFGARHLRHSEFELKSPDAVTPHNWSHFLTGVAHRVGLEGDLRTVLMPRYAWVDQFAEYYAQSYRSTYVTNFSLAAIAVILSILGATIGWGNHELGFVLGELIVLLFILVNTWRGNREHWHARWLDYRHLAERLRNLRFSSLFGDLNLASASAADFGGGPGWVIWYARATARELNLPSVSVDPPATSELIESFIHDQLSDQISYHAKNGKILSKLDQRTHSVGIWFFRLTAIFCALYVALNIVAYFIRSPTSDWRFEWCFNQYKHYMPIFTIGLPALGTALFGIRVQGDFRGRADRSALTANGLDKIRHLLTGFPCSWGYLRMQVNKAANIMLDDLADWRVTYARRRLDLPA